MATTLYADTANIVEALTKARETATLDETVTVSVYDSEAVMDGLTRDAVENRNLFGHLGEHICSLEYDSVELTVTFHESKVDGTFELTPAGHDAIDADQSSDPKELAPMVGHVLESVEQEWDIISYDFDSITAGSMATGGHLTDYEFEYVCTGF